jgi:hypothetical protein
MRGNITRRGKNSWQLKFDVPSVDGKRQQRYATVRGTYKDAQKELTRLLGAADEGALPDPSTSTVAEYLRAWLDTMHGLSPKTLERYRELGDRQIIPHLGATNWRPNKCNNGTAPSLQMGCRHARSVTLTRCYDPYFNAPSRTGGSPETWQASTRRQRSRRTRLRY